MKITVIPTFQAGDGRVLQFVKVTGVPGFSHKVIIDGVATREWLADDFKPSAKAALFFLTKLGGVMRAA